MIFGAEETPGNLTGTSNDDLKEKVMGFANYAQESVGTDTIMSALLQTNNVLSYLLSFLAANLLAVAALFADLAFQLFLYFSVISLLVDRDRSVIDLAVEAIPAKTEIKNGVKDLFENAISGVLRSTVEGAAFQAVGNP